MKILIVAVLLVLTACASKQPLESSIEGATGEDTVFVQANAEVEEEPEPPRPPIVMRELPPEEPATAKPKAPAESQKALAEAKAKATRSPGNFINGYQIYDYLPGAIYELFAAPGFVSSIMLEPGEQLIDAAAGDTVRWIVGDATTGDSGQSRTILMVKPVEKGLRTNMVITTDARVYLLDLRSQRGAYNSAIAWNYPQDDLQTRSRRFVQRSLKARDSSLAGVNVERLDFNYTVTTVKGDDPRWKPIRVFNDGAKSYIEFPPNIGVMETPPMFVVGETDGPELVNYRVRAPYYVVDKLIDVAELRMGTDKPIIVRIERGNNVAGRTP